MLEVARHNDPFALQEQGALDLLTVETGCDKFRHGYRFKGLRPEVVLTQKWERNRFSMIGDRFQDEVGFCLVLAFLTKQLYTNIWHFWCFYLSCVCWFPAPRRASVPPLLVLVIGSHLYILDCSTLPLKRMCITYVAIFCC